MSIVLMPGVHSPLDTILTFTTASSSRPYYATAGYVKGESGAVSREVSASHNRRHSHMTLGKMAELDTEELEDEW